MVSTRTPSNDNATNAHLNAKGSMLLELGRLGWSTGVGISVVSTRKLTNDYATNAHLNAKGSMLLELGSLGWSSLSRKGDLYT